MNLRATNLQVITPTTEQEWDAYYALRYQVLRKPFRRPPGSEKDEYDQVGQHRMLVKADNSIVGIGRLHFNSSEEAQIRFMVVAPKYQGEGHGVLLVQSLELLARQQGAKRVIIRSRDTTLGFYLKCGYEIKEEGNTVDNPMAEHQLVKLLDPVNHIVYRPTWCGELQKTWHNEIPVSKAMDIRIYQYTGRSIELRAPLSRNINVHGTMFAGSLYTLATLTGWGLLQLQLRERGLTGAIVLAEGNIKYRKPVIKEPRAVAYLNEMKGDFSPLENGENARINMSVIVRDGDLAGAEFKGEYVVLAPRENNEQGENNK